MSLLESGEPADPCEVIPDQTTQGFLSACFGAAQLTGESLVTIRGGRRGGQFNSYILSVAEVDVTGSNDPVAPGGGNVPPGAPGDNVPDDTPGGNVPGAP